ncbi:MAG: hypothetical protein Q8929_19095, partial [Bacillota bacterium]|nr:hypothetical protein [Bacillota bacterium]
VGDVLTYTVSATNTGNVALTNVHVSDPLTTPNAKTCANVAVGASCVLNGTYTVTATDASNGTINNTGQATSNEFCGDGCTYFSASLNTSIATPSNNPAISVLKQLTNNADGDDSGTVTLGDVLTYTVTATNTGSIALTNVHVSDPLTTPSAITCATVAVGATCVLSGTHTVTATDVSNGSIDNTGSATASPLPGSFSSSISTPVAGGNAAMTVAKVLASNADGDDSGTVTLGDVLTYTVTATNTGSIALTNVHVSDPLTTPSAINCATVAVGATCVLSGAHTVTATDVSHGSIDNTGSATAAQVTQAVSSSISTPVAGGNPAMTVAKVLASNADGDDSGTVTLGDVLTYTVTATNTGSVTLTNVHVSDPLTTPSAITCATVAVGATCVLSGTHTVTATDVSHGSINNTGSATASQLTGSFSSSISTPVAGGNPAMTVAKVLASNADGDGSGTVTLGDVLTYTVTAT